MDLARPSPIDRLGVLAAGLVVVTGLISTATGWGAILVLAVLAGVGTLGVILAPRFAPSVRLPGSRGSLLVLLGVVAILSWIPPLIAWLSWIVEHLLSVDTIQFLVGLVGATVLALTGYIAFEAEGGRFQLGVPTPAGQPAPELNPPPSDPDPADHGR
jgi:hypothetical protein